MTFTTEQENFWAGDFGDEYIMRNQSSDLLAANLALFAKIFDRNQMTCKTIMEIGANIGMNLDAIKKLLPNSKLSAVEINEKAVEVLRKKNIADVHQGSILDINNSKVYDLVFTKGVLIHISPEKLKSVYEKIYHMSSNYICLIEYYNPAPVQIKYRNHEDRLYKRDFAGEIMDIYADLKLIDYGFVYHRAAFSQDDLTWFLLKK